MLLPAALGLATIDHEVPSQFITNVSVPELPKNLPTATQNVVETHDTDFNSLTPTPLLGLVIVVHDEPFQAFTNV